MTTKQTIDPKNLSDISENSFSGSLISGYTYNPLSDTYSYDIVTAYVLDKVRLTCSLPQRTSNNIIQTQIKTMDFLVGCQTTLEEFEKGFPSDFLSNLKIVYIPIAFINTVHAYPSRINNTTVTSEISIVPENKPSMKIFPNFLEINRTAKLIIQTENLYDDIVFETFPKNTNLTVSINNGPFSSASTLKILLYDVLANNGIVNLDFKFSGPIDYEEKIGFYGESSKTFAGFAVHGLIL